MILKDKKWILFFVVYLEGEYGCNNFYLGVFIILGGDGIEYIIEFFLMEKENEGLKCLIEFV